MLSVFSGSSENLPRLSLKWQDRTRWALAFPPFSRLRAPVPFPSGRTVRECPLGLQSGELLKYGLQGSPGEFDLISVVFKTDPIESLRFGFGEARELWLGEGTVVIPSMLAGEPRILPSFGRAVGSALSSSLFLAGPASPARRGWEGGG